MKVFVTGGCGFIGSALVRFLLDGRLAEVLNLDRLTYAGSPLRLVDYENRSGYVFQQGDIADRSLVRNIFETFQPDAVIHLAAESHVDRSIDAPSDFIQTNIVGTFVLLEESRRHLKLRPNPNFRFLHVSTDEVFGSLPPGERFDVDSDYDPSSPYSASKAAADHLVRAWCRTYGFPAVITNCSNNYGPFQFPEKLIPLTIAKCQSRQPIPVYGDGKQVRDWLHVEDHVEALWTVLRRGKLTDTYLIGGESPLENIEVVHRICRIMDELVPCEEGSYRRLITFVEDRPGHDRRYAMCIDRIKEDLGWSPKRPFASGLRSTVQWYLEHQELMQVIVADRYRGERLGTGSTKH